MPEEHQITVHTRLSFNSRTESFDENLSFTISQTTGLIENVYERPSSEIPSMGTQDIDLRSLVVLPGLVDAHTHIFLHSYEETSALDQMRNESFVERVLRAANHCKAALMAGYTTYRDLGTEGMGDADLDIRDSINRCLIPGPRLFVATNPIASSGGYTLPQETRIGHRDGPLLADTADGVEGVRAAVRRRIGAGADIIKFYADSEKRSLRFPEPTFQGNLPVRFPYPEVGGKPHHYPLFSQAETDAIVSEAHEANCPVAAHASSSVAVIRAAKAGVDTIEHGQDGGEEALDAILEAGSIFVPTLTVMEAEVPEEPLREMYANVKKAWEKGVRLAAGGDIGPVAHGENVRELELMVGAGVPVEKVLAAATLGGWEACGGERCGRRFGWLGEGAAGDFVGVEGDPRADLGSLRRVRFVMKDGRVWKQDGKFVENS
jgi:imidazolonepropionase-like amidohydrolase